MRWPEGSRMMNEAGDPKGAIVVSSYQQSGITDSEG